MILDGFRSLPDFPFAGYFGDIGQYTHARLYWKVVLRHAIGFDEGDWQPDPESDDFADAMYCGLAVRLSSPVQAKQIWIDTRSLAGEVNMVLRENAPMVPDDLPDDLDDETRARMLAGLPEDRLRAETELSCDRLV